MHRSELRAGPAASPLKGFSGDAAGSKIFVTKMRMPLSTSTPAYWILPGQVIRSSQYGCNCRQEGCPAPYKGGCGELDVVEVTGGVATTLVASTSIYLLPELLRQASASGIAR